MTMFKRSSGFLAGVLFGSVVGAAIAMVLAPQTGSSTRSRVSNQFAMLNRRIQSMRSTADTIAADDIAQPAANSYEPPRIVLDQSISASTTSSDSV